MFNGCNTTVRQGSNVNYILGDHLGSNTAADTSNNIVNDVRFYPFGGLRSGGINDNITDRGFTGHRENRDIGLTYMNARYYLPYINRFGLLTM